MRAILAHNLPKLGKSEAMRLLGKDKLQHLLCADEISRAWICAWVAELATANWKQPADVALQFPNARESGLGTFVFPVANTDKEVCIQIAFQQGVAVITGLQ